MKYGICNLSIVPLRLEASDKSELVSQLLYGDFFMVLEQRKSWSKIQLDFDNYEGWIDNKQFLEISKEDYDHLRNEPLRLSTDLVEFVQNEKEQIFAIPMGAVLNGLQLLGHKHDGNFVNSIQPKEQIILTAFNYLNTPYLWGGKTPFGIDCSGFTQMVYKLNGYKLSRDACEQATQGTVLSFIEESEPGDLAFFDNDEGKIVHVGIILKDNYIIHSHGKVRIDRLDHSGIYNVDKNIHSHKLRVMKKII